MSEFPSARTFVRRYRSLFLSDLHLGSLGSRADLVLEFLRRNEAEAYWLVGDILDVGQSLPSRWSAADQAVVDLLRDRWRAGAQVVYVRGNHDPAASATPAERRMPVPAVDHATHRAADGRRYLVVHGDGQDRLLFRWHPLTRIGGHADHLLRAGDALVGQWLGRGSERRSIIEGLLSRLNRGLYPGRSYERRLIELASGAGYDGVICGHFHIPELRKIGALSYANCGDWIDSFTAVGEDHGGRMRLLGGRRAFAAAPRPPFREAVARA